MKATKNGAKTYAAWDRLDFGKYRGFPVSYVCKVDPSYIKWMFDNGLCAKVSLDTPKPKRPGKLNTPRKPGI